MNEYIITENQLKTAMEACLKREIPLPITNVFISGDKLPEIVRCVDCKHATDDGYGCTLFGRREQMGNYRWDDVPAEVEPDGFCVWGERRDA